MKITFMGAGSTVFARNVIGDCMCSEALRDSVFALYDIDGTRLEESRTILEAMRSVLGGYGRIECYLGVENRRKALAGATFVVNAIQVGGYDPATIIDFEIPKKYGLRQTIADTLGIGDRDGNDLYPEIKSRVDAKIADPEFKDKVRFDYIRNFGYYCTESSEHNAEYNGFYIKSRYPEICAAMNRTNINVQLLTVEAARTHKLEHVYQAAMLDPHTGSELDIDTIKEMVDELIAAHGDYLPQFH